MWVLVVLVTVSGGVRLDLAQVGSSFPDTTPYAVYALARAESGFER